ncbi:MAG: hypothetical protein RBS73_18255 [Prolixibacteraceae bacterium]|nr:hypothetical protein [Prolixibacteraceae bacterium]
MNRCQLFRITTCILAFEGGSYSEYEENKKKRLGDMGPHRIKYRKLVKG